MQQFPTGGLQAMFWWVTENQSDLQKCPINFICYNNKENNVLQLKVKYREKIHSFVKRECIMKLCVKSGLSM